MVGAAEVEAGEATGVAPEAAMDLVVVAREVVVMGAVAEAVAVGVEAVTMDRGS